MLICLPFPGLYRSPDLLNRDDGPTVAFAGGSLTGSGGGLGTGPPWGFNIVEGYNSADSDEEVALGWDHHQVRHVPQSLTCSLFSVY